MRLRIADDLLEPASIGQTVRYVAHVPVLVRRLLQQLDPHVGHEHAETVVEAQAAVLELATQSRHARDILCDRDGVRVDLADKSIREAQVDNTVKVRVQTKVL